MVSGPPCRTEGCWSDTHPRGRIGCPSQLCSGRPCVHQRFCKSEREECMKLCVTVAGASAGAVVVALGIFILSLLCNNQDTVRRQSLLRPTADLMFFSPELLSYLCARTHPYTHIFIPHIQHLPTSHHYPGAFSGPCWPSIQTICLPLALMGPLCVLLYT